MAKKDIELPDELEEIIKETQDKEAEQEHEAFVSMVQKKRNKKASWDVTKQDTIKYFDPNLSYELTGYKPISKTQSLDFKPSWFTEAREAFLLTGHYTQYPRNTKAYGDFWDREYERCRNGMTSHGYTITGDHYFFLNYYQLQDLASASKAGTARSWDFPKFFAAQYVFFHYLECAKQLRLNAVLMKARATGFSEINASILANAYNCRKGSRNIIVAYSEALIDPSLDKLWNALNWINDNTDGGFFKLRQVRDTRLLKRASYYKIENGQKIEDGWMAQIEGRIVDKANKLRGERTDLLVFEECGSFPGLTKTFIQGQALQKAQGIRFGISILGGTGGDQGPGLEGLREIFYNPETYEVLPFKHNYTSTGEYIKSGFFLPANLFINLPEYMDSRGFTDPELGKQYHENDRKRFINSPKSLMIHCAEQCLTVEEAFSREGNNNFDQTIIAEQLTAIRITKQAPHIELGDLSYIYSTNSNRDLKSVTGYRWEPNVRGKVHILEHPVWSNEYRAQKAKQQEETFMGEEPEEKHYEPMRNLYVAGIDSIDIGQEDTSDETDNPSKFCIIIFKRAYGIQDPVPVAYYMDRPMHIRDAYKTAMCMVTYYQALVNLEATRVNLYAWARDHGYAKYFMLRPRATYPDINKVGKRTLGTPATPAIINHQLELIEAYIEDYGQHIWFEALLDELNRYTLEQKTHFDMVAAFGMAMLANEELNGVVVVNEKPSEKELSTVLGYYYDENGYKHFGIVPTRRHQPLVSIDETLGHRGSSDPRKWGY